MKEPQFISLTQAAMILGCEEKMVVRQAKIGVLSATYNPADKQWLFLLEDVVKLRPLNYVVDDMAKDLKKYEEYFHQETVKFKQQTNRLRATMADRSNHFDLINEFLQKCVDIFLAHEKSLEGEVLYDLLKGYSYNDIAIKKNCSLTLVRKMALVAIKSIDRDKCLYGLHQELKDARKKLKCTETENKVLWRQLSAIPQQITESKEDKKANKLCMMNEDILTHILAAHIKSLDISLNAKYALLDIDIHYVYQLIKYSEDDLSSLPRIGYSAIQDIKRNISERGLVMPVNLPPSILEKVKKLVEEVEHKQEISRQNILTQPVDIILMNHRWINALNRVGIFYVFQFSEMTEGQLLAIRGFGKNGFLALDKALKDVGQEFPIVLTPEKYQECDSVTRQYELEENKLLARCREQYGKNKHIES